MIFILKGKEPQEADANSSYNIENEINTFRNRLKANNIENVNAKKYDYQDGVYYMDFISECERLGDYVINVVEAWCTKGMKLK